MEVEDSRRNLIINYLPQHLEDEDFHDLFAAIGPVASSKIIRHKQTGCSLGYGFVEYEKNPDALNAICTLNQLQLQDKVIKVAFARQPEESIKECNLYINGLPSTMTQQWLEDEFGKFGKILRSKVLINQSGECRGTGFVLFERKEFADKAIEALNGENLSGCNQKLTIKLAEANSAKTKKPQAVTQPMKPVGPQAPRGPGSYPMQMGNPPNTGYAQVSSSMPGYNATADSSLGGPIRSLANRSQNRFNPVVNAPARKFEEPVQPPGGYTMQTPGGGDGGFILFVYNIGEDAKEHQLWSLFSRYGTVMNVHVMLDLEKKTAKNYAFVTMADYDEALKAIEVLNGACALTEKPLRVSFKTPGKSF